MSDDARDSEPSSPNANDAGWPTTTRAPSGAKLAGEPRGRFELHARRCSAVEPQRFETPIGPAGAAQEALQNASAAPPDAPRSPNGTPSANTAKPPPIATDMPPPTWNLYTSVPVTAWPW